MLHDIYNYSRLGTTADGDPGRAGGSGDPIRNPWLLWRPERPIAPQLLTVAELDECHCPDVCNRDHANE